MSVAIVLGGAACALAELGEAELIAPNAPIIAANDAFRVAPRKPIAFATLHSEKARQFLDGCDLDGVRLFAHAPAAGWDFELVQERFGGSSGLFATLIAIRQLGFAGVILAGVPMEARARHITSAAEWSPAHVDKYQRGWLRAADVMKLRPRVRSMSGWTRATFGAPGAAWFERLSQPELRRHSSA